MSTLPALIVVLLSTACSRQGEQVTKRDSASTAMAVVTAAPTEAPRDTVGPGAIRWTLGGLEHRLRDVGLEPVAAGEVRQPFMGGPGMRYKLEGGEIQAYVYADAGAVARDTDRLDTATVSPPTMMISWAMPPTLIISNNLAVILLTRDVELRRKVRAAVTQD